MKTFTSAFLSALAVTIALCAVPAAASPGKRALLIGIQQYPDAPLEGPLNDVALIKRLLVERLGFPEAHIATLLDSAATHTGIQAAFTALDKATEPGDFVYIHYSGHGSRHGAHSTWVPFGARGQAGGAENLDNYDILDSEVGQWLQGVYAKTPHVLLVSDSCHSGHFTRGGQNTGVTRGMARDPRPHPLDRAEYRPGQFSGAKVTATEANELSYEYEASPGAKHGRFTWFWAESIAAAQPGETWKDIFNRSYHKTVFSDQGQHPLFNGKLPLGVLDGREASVSSGLVIAAASALEDGTTKVVLNAGRLEGVTVGSRYAKADGTELEITAVQAFASEGRTLDKSGRFAKGELVRETRHMFRGEPLKLALEVGEEARAVCAQRLGDAPGFVLTDQTGEADYVLTSAPASPRDGAAPLVNLESRGEQKLAGPFALPRGENGLDCSAVAEALKRLRRVRDLKALGSSQPDRGAPPIALRIVHWTPVDAAAGQAAAFQETREFDSGAAGPSTFGKKGEFKAADLDLQHLKAGDILTFTLKNADEKLMRDYFCYLLDISDDGTVDFLFPDGRYHGQGRLAFDAEQEVWPNYHVVAPGRETVKLLVTDKRLENHEQLAQEGYAALTHRGEANPLRELLADAFAGRPATTRGGADDTWFTEQFTVVGE